MDLFVIDNAGESELLEKNEYNNEKYVNNFNLLTETSSQPKSAAQNTLEAASDSSDDDSDFGDLPRFTVDLSHILKGSVKSPPKDEIDLKLEEFCERLGIGSNEKQKALTNDLYDHQKSANVAMELKNCDKAAAAAELAKSLANPSETKKAKLRKAEASKTKGKNWYNMPATELTEEVKRDIEIIQMRSVLDPKHFYKKNDLKALPKYFQVGKVMPSALDFYNERGERKNKKKTIVDELMADAQFQKFNKRKYTEAIEEKRKGSYHKANQKMKKLKKNK